MKVIIIGAGIAGITAAFTIRKRQPDTSVTVIGKEPYIPYNRYLLTEYLCNQISDDALYFTDYAEFQEMGVKFRKGEYVKHIDPGKHQIKLNNNEIMNYDQLLIATGASQRVGSLLSSYSQHIQSYYNLQDILLVKRKLDTIQHCVIYGANLSNLDLMSGMHNLGKKITYIVKDDKVAFHLLKDENADIIEEFLQVKDIDIILEDKPVSVHPVKNGYQVDTLHGKSITTDMVFTWDDRLPNVDFFKSTDIYKKKGILVDTKLQTSIKDIYAAGDCIEIYHPVLKNYWINFGWPNAREQGEIAGRNIIGDNIEYQIHDTLTFNIMGKPLKARWWD